VYSRLDSQLQSNGGKDDDDDDDGAMMTMMMQKFKIFNFELSLLFLFKSGTFGTAMTLSLAQVQRRQIRL
jgi:hypothetical protein